MRNGNEWHEAFPIGSTVMCRCLFLLGKCQSCRSAKRKASKWCLEYLLILRISCFKFTLEVYETNNKNEIKLGRFIVNSYCFTLLWVSARAQTSEISAQIHRWSSNTPRKDCVYSVQPAMSFVTLQHRSQDIHGNSWLCS